MKPRRRFSVAAKQRGQAMIEYIVVTAFGLMVLLGPGLDVMAEMARVMQENYRGYSYGMSLSQLPDYGTGTEFRTEMLNAGVDSATVAQLGIDPLEDEMLDQLAEYMEFKDDMEGLVDEFTDFDVQDFFEEAASSAFSFF